MEIEHQVIELGNMALAVGVAGLAFLFLMGMLTYGHSEREW